MSLAAAVPVMAGWKLSNLPKGLESDQLDRVLGGCDRRTPMGRRDYAVLLLSRPGLCAGKIARLGLDDIDWAHGEITIVGKSNRLASKKDWDARERDVKPISPALSPNAARSALEDLDEKWSKKYRAIIRSWENAWEEFVPVLDYDIEIRRVICSTNAIWVFDLPCWGSREPPRPIPRAVRLEGASPPSRPR